MEAKAEGRWCQGSGRLLVNRENVRILHAEFLTVIIHSEPIVRKGVIALYGLLFVHVEQLSAAPSNTDAREYGDKNIETSLCRDCILVYLKIMPPVLLNSRSKDV